MPRLLWIGVASLLFPTGCIFGVFVERWSAPTPAPVLTPTQALAPTSTAAPPARAPAIPEDQQEFLKMARQHAQDPTGLEILKWGELISTDTRAGLADRDLGKASYTRSISFRCACVRLDHGPPVQQLARGEQPDRGTGARVSRVDAGLYYDANKKLVRVLLDDWSSWDL